MTSKYFMKEYVRQGILDIDMLNYYIKKGIAFYDDFIIWSKAHRLNFHKVNLYLPYKKI